MVEHAGQGSFYRDLCAACVDEAGSVGRRGVRTVTDRAVITVCDTRLVTTRYGRDMLAGLPPFPVVKSTVPRRTEQRPF